MAIRPSSLAWVLVALVTASCALAGPSAADDTTPRPSTPTPAAPRGPVFLEPPEGRVLHGLGQWRGGNEAFEQGLTDPSLRGAAALIFVHLGDWPRRGWDRRVLGFLGAVEKERAAGRILNVTLHLGGLVDDEIFGIDADIALGTPDAARYEERVRECARIIDASGLPAFVRIGGEMNGDWEDQHPYLFPKAYRRVVEIFDEEGADDVAFVWCYMPAAAGDFDESRGGEAKWYPGDDVVDWFGLDVFRREDFVPARAGRGAEVGRAARSGRFLAMARAHGKPVILNETSAVDVALTPDPADGARDWDTWFEPFFAFVGAHPEIKAVHYVNVDWQTIGAARERGWLNADVTTNPIVQERFGRELRRSRWLHEPEIRLLHGAAEAFGPDRLAPIRRRLEAELDRAQRAPREADPRRGAQRGGR